ncbi:MAG: universal stress protein [Nitrososphaerota archaeon]|nr:universal stress protein [Nitrososphaerota archaeon]
MPNGVGFKSVVVAYDGSKDADKAVAVACSIAAKYGSKVAILHVFRSPSTVYAPGPGMPIPDFGDLESAAEQVGKGVLTRGLAVASKAGVTAKGELIESPSAVEAIVTFASQERADLIILGTRGMTGFKKLVLGSVSTGVVSHAHCAVLVVR